MEEKNVKSSPRDVFMYLLATVSLYFSVFAVLNLLSFYIDYFLPDPLNPYYQPGAAARWPIALLIVIFPVYLWVSRFLARDLRAAPEKKDLRIRRWLLYLTVFLAAALLIGDLVALIYRFLEGDLALPFVLKVISIFAVGAGVFWYYLYDLRRQPAEFSSQARVFVWSASALVLAVVVCGFFVAGSPFRQRLIRFDEQKVSDLQNIQWQTVSYWQNKGNLPADLDALRDSISGFVPPHDPQSDESYVYRVTGSLSFELCAKFNLPSESGQTGRMEVPVGKVLKDENWQHETGEQCFTRTIDPELYRLNKSTPTGPSVVNSFSSCAAAGYPIQESQPRRCQVSSTKVFAELQGDVVCAQVITLAENPITGESGTFPTPCDVPLGWVPVR